MPTNCSEVILKSGLLHQFIMKFLGFVLILCAHLQALTSAKGKPKCHKDFIQYKDWILAFRAEAHIGISVYDTWMNDAIYHDSPVIPRLIKPECISLNSTCKPCHHHFKSRIVPLWDRSNVEKVKFLMLKDSEIKAEILFDGRGSTKTSWFSQNRVISSTWTDLKTAPANFFSIRGDRNYPRPFFINSFYSSCPGDTGWVFVNDGRQKNVCKWDNPTRFPNFIYSKKSTRAKTGENLEDFDYADVLMILVKIRS